MGNEAVKRNILAGYVHDAMESEAAIYTIDQAISGCEKRKEELIAQVKEKEAEGKGIVADHLHAVSWYESSLQSEKDAYWHAVNTYPTFGWGDFFGSFFAALIPLGLIILIISWIVSLFGAENAYVVGGIIAFTIALIIALSQTLPDYIESKKKADMDIDKKDKNKTQIARRLKLAKDALKEAEDKTGEELLQLDLKAQSETRLLNDQIDELSSKRRILRSNLDKFYAYGIIPPDYRYFDCVTILDQIFRNDLADTIRAAVLLYEDRVFRGEVIRGMDKICQKLDSLSDGMRAVVGQLRSINASVDGMRRDLNRRNQEFMEKHESWMSELRRSNEALANESRRSQALSAELLKETQIGRFTNEKLLESSKRLEYYAQEYRMGRMPRDYMN